MFKLIGLATNDLRIFTYNRLTFAHHHECIQYMMSWGVDADICRYAHKFIHIYIYTVQPTQTPRTASLCLGYIDCFWLLGKSTRRQPTGSFRSKCPCVLQCFFHIFWYVHVFSGVSWVSSTSRKIGPVQVSSAYHWTTELFKEESSASWPWQKR